MCPEWLHDFKAFHDWAVTSGYADGLTLDRIDNGAGYSPENCRWSTPLEQANNTRSARMISYRGETYSLHEWARRLGIVKKLPVDVAFAMPIQDSRLNLKYFRPKEA